MVLLPLLAAAFLVLTNLPARATPPGNSGYLAMQVADLPGAVHFFRTMLNCAPVDASAGTSQTALLDCGNGNIVSLTRGSARVSHAPVGSLTTDDASATATWLCSRGVRIAGGPSIVTEGMGLHQVAVTLVTPWVNRFDWSATRRTVPLRYPPTRLVSAVPLWPRASSPQAEWCSVPEEACSVV